MLKESGKAISADTEWKIYSAINNLIKAGNFRANDSWKIPINA